MTTTDAVLSDTQLRVLEFLCMSGASPAAPIAEYCGAREVTLISLQRLGLIERRTAGARDPLYHFTKLGRDLYCAQNTTGLDHEDGPLHEQEVPTMTATKTPETTADESAAVTPNAVVVRSSGKATTTPAKRTRKPAATAKSKPKTDEAVPPVVPAADYVPELEPTAGGYAPLREKLLAAIMLGFPGAETAEKPGPNYVRITLTGKTLVYVFEPTRKGIRVEIPRVGSSSYDAVKVDSDEQISSVVEAAEVYLAAVEKAKAAKAA